MKFFHGTNAEIRPGEFIQSAASLGIRTRHGAEEVPGEEWRAHRAYASTNETNAWHYATQHFLNKDGRNDELFGTPGGRMRVYEVEPVGDIAKGSEHTESHPEYTAAAWRVKHENLAPPGRQTTFPQLNWNQFKGHESSIDYNQAPAVKRKITMADQLPATVDDNQLDLFTGKSARVSSSPKVTATPEEKYHQNARRGRTIFRPEIRTEY